MSDLKVFEFESQNVRVILISGEPWFVAKDVLDAVGSTTTVSALETLIKEGLGDEFVSNQDILDAIGREQKSLIISESGLTYFVSRSRTELGRKMNRWLHVEVLPSIRKTGSYSKSKSQIELIIESAQQLLEIERRVQENESAIASITTDVKEIQDRADAAVAELKALPPASKNVPCRTTRNNINTRLRAYCHATGLKHGDVWGELYREFRVRYHIDLKVRAANGKSAPLDIAENLDVIDDLYAMSCELFKFEGE